MTNIQATIAVITIPGWNCDSVEKALIDLGIEPEEIYTAGNKLIDKAALVVLKGMLALHEISEGDYTIIYAIKDRIADIEGDLGITKDRYVKNASFYW